MRPKAVQSVRGGRGGFYPDKRVKAWKASILPYIVKACGRQPPTELPLVITRLVYKFRYPKTTPRAVREFIDAGGVVPYIGTCDITDNLAKGLIDTCAGHVFVNDKMIWRTADIEKLYASEDGIHIEFAETPDVMTIDGRRADGVAPGCGQLF